MVDIDVVRNGSKVVRCAYQNLKGKKKQSIKLIFYYFKIVQARFRTDKTTCNRH